MNTRRQTLARLAAWCAAPAVLPLRAQGGAPTLRVIVPTPAGGASDAAARVLLQAWSRASGRQAVVDNRPGANGALAARALQDARPDGHTLLWTLASMTGIPLLQKTPPFQSLAEFAPVGMVARLLFAMFVPADSPARSVADFVALARGAAESPSCAHGTLGEWMAAAQFARAAGARLAYVPYKGGAQLMPDLASSRVHVNFGPLAGALAQIRAGRLRALAVMSDARSPLLPELPTLAEAGLVTGALPTWQALFAPAGTPPDTVRSLSREMATALRETEVRSQFERQAVQPEGGTPEALAALLRNDFETWRTFVREHAIAPE